jgi:hypothetical protein
MENLSSTYLLNHYLSTDDFGDSISFLNEKQQEQIEEFFAKTASCNQKGGVPVEVYAHGESLTDLVDLARQVSQIVEKTPHQLLGFKSSCEWQEKAIELISYRVEQAYKEKAKYYSASMVGKVIYAILQIWGDVSNLQTPSMREASVFMENLNQKCKLLKT